ncbi:MULTISPECIES: restriction endonuclease subunit S [Trichocoleus]|uniref:Restriction endonuclease subunit S n=1 Tax=Trichocoleus desertorum GB2-A4 TaxID=2933944 RepID=A0ABV0JFB6_9CYAN|nr:restriction endonuclease subunit S [Trichocoleus sp. FACHB-46]MBD1865186.1 restriction endonuclease subunit S [Trichocoleus sp. FACHB-46]
MSNELIELPEGWQWAEFADVTTNYDGTRIPVSSSDRQNRQGDFPYYGASGIIDYVDDYIFEGEYLLIAEDGANLLSRSTPIAFNANGKFWVNNHAHVVQVIKDLVLNSYLRDYINSTDLRFYISGSAQPKLNQKNLNRIPIPLPPLDEQKRIVAKIEELRDRHQRAKQALEAIPELCDRFRQSVLAAAFRGDLTADWREENPDIETAQELVERTTAQLTSGKTTGRAATINIIPGRAALSVGDPQTAVPKNWCRVPLLKIARLESGHTPSRKHPEYWDGDIAWLGIADAREHHGKHIFDTCQHTNEKGLENSAARLLPKHTVCLSRTASVGYVVIMGKPMATSQDFVNWICSDALLPDFLMYALLAENEHLLKFGKGTTHTTIYFPEAKSFHITLPPLEEQKEIIRRIGLFLKAIYKVEQEYKIAQPHLDHLNQSILAKAFRGELVEQDPNDEPASVLLERIRAEREKADNGKKTKGRQAKQLKLEV